jgi:TRAP transporter TAXI family solute receptor
MMMQGRKILTTETRRKFIRVLFSGFAVLFVSGWLNILGPSSALAAEAKPLPRSLIIATHAVGTGFHSDGSVVAKVVSEHLPMTMVVRPHPGPPAWLPAMNNGEIEFGIIVGSDSATAFRGVGAHRKAYPNIRLLMIGAPMHLAFWAPTNSPIKTTADLKGKRVPSGWAGLPIIQYTGGAALANGGLTWDDVVKVPVAELAENLRAFMEGRTDVLWHSVGAPAVQEANVRISGGVRPVAIRTSPESLKRMADFNPGTYMMMLKKGTAVGIVEDVAVQSEDITVVAPAQLPEEVVAAVLKVLWDSNDELRKVTPRMRAWTQERMISTQAAVPYHPAAIKFFRDKGVWSPDMEALQQRLLGR